MKRLLYNVRFIIAQSSILVGGQAVIEGVMMRVPGAYATAVRDNSGTIHLQRKVFISIADKYPMLKIPFIRGIVGLFESLKIGYSTLQWSADIIESEESGDNKPNQFIDAIMTLLSIALAIGLFFAAPMGLTSWLFNYDQNAFVYNLLSGMFRVIFFILYLILISLMKDVRRLFQYHGAEHKTVYNFESGKDLKISNAQQFPTQHPRCGTSFMFIIMIVAILSFSILDSIIMIYINDLKVWMRILFHIPFIPVVSGMGYELLKLTAKYRNNIVFKLLALPGLWLQNITTKQPDNDQVEVALKALIEAFGPDIKKYTKGNKYIAEAIG